MKFFTKGSGTGRKVIPIKNDSDLLKYTMPISGQGLRLIKQAEPFYKYSRHLKSLEQELKSELGDKQFAQVRVLYNQIMHSKFDIKRFLKENDRWKKNVWSIKALKRTFYDLPLLQYHYKVGMPQPEFLDRDETAFVIAGMKKGIPDKILYKFVLLNNIPYSWSRGVSDRPTAFNRFFRDIDISDLTKRLYKDSIFVESAEDSPYIPAGMKDKNIADVLKTKWNV